MGFLKKIEGKLEKAVEGFFAKGFKSKVEPVELGKKMAIEMLNNKVVAMEKVWAPNDFKVFLSSSDMAEYAQYKKELIAELQDFLIKKAASDGLSMMGRPLIDISKNKTLKTGVFIVRAKINEDLKEEINKTKNGATQLIKIEPITAKSSKHYIRVEPSMLRYSLKEGKNLAGRSATNDISVADPLISRHHVELFLKDNEVILKDIGSTNGTKVNGKDIESVVLRNKDVIEIGDTKLIYGREDA